MKYNMNKYVYEYVFARQIDFINSLRADGDWIKVREAKSIHKKFLDEVKKVTNPKNPEFTISIDKFNTIMSDMFGDEYIGDEAVKDEIAEFMTLVNHEKGVNNLEVKGGVIPISPYMEEIANNEVMLDNGASIVYLNADDLRESKGEITHGLRYSLNPDEDVDKMKQFVTKSDITGLSALRPYISSNDYLAVKDWFNAINEKDAMSSKSIEKSVGILRYLSENGYEYKIKKDFEVGQLKAVLSNGLDVRITDKESASRYLGRCYNNAVTSYITRRDEKYFIRNAIVKKDAEGNILNPKECIKNHDLDDLDLSLDEIIDVIKYSLGEKVERKDNYNNIRHGEKALVGENTQYIRKVKNKSRYPRPDKEVSYNASYISSSSGVSAIYDLYNKDNRGIENPLILYRNNQRKPQHKLFYVNVGNDEQVVSPDKAYTYLQDGISEAKTNLLEFINLDGIDKAVHDGTIDDFAFSGDEIIRDIQEKYVDVLVNDSKFDVMMSEDNNEVICTNEEIEDINNIGDPILRAGAHLDLYLNKLIGSMDYDPVDGKTFNSNMMAKYMDGDINFNSKSIIEAVKIVGTVHTDAMRGNDAFNKQMRNAMVTFGDYGMAETSKMMDWDNPFVKDCLKTIIETANTSGFNVKEEDVEIDSNGIILIKGNKFTKDLVYSTDKSGNIDKKFVKPFVAEIGPLFIPDDRGVVKTNYVFSDNYAFIPGYEASVVAQKEGENKSLEERTKLTGYKEKMLQALKFHVRDLAYDKRQFGVIGNTMALSQVYKELYETRYPLDFEEKAKERGMDEKFIDDVIRTNARRVKYSNTFRDETTFFASYADKNKDINDEHVFKSDVLNDNYYSPYALAGRNMSILSEDGDGYFDKDATGGSTNQGIVRFLTEGTQIDENGFMIRSELDDKTPLMKNNICRYFEHIPFDRRQMTFSNLLTALSITKPTKTAQMTFGGFNFDDGYVISKEFAEQHQVPDTNGGLRSLVAGDKLSDMYGNKGVISIIIDRNMSDEDAKVQKLEKAVEWFKVNPELDVVGAPYPAMSRFNAGSAKELMENPSDLIAPDGRVFEGCIGETTYIVTDMTVDEKSHIYDEEAIAMGKGRRTSSQLCWALDALDATATKSVYYANNDSSLANYREFLITVGLDMDELGNLRNHYEPHKGETRPVFEIPKEMYYENSNKFNKEGLKNLFSDDISKSGGFLKVPFRMEYGDGTEFAQDKDGNYLMPIMSTHLRSSREMIDGQVVKHNYTSNYLSIASAIIDYNKENFSDNPDAKVLDKAMREAQASFDKLRSDVEERRFSGKNNYAKTNLMGNRLKNSSTQVIIADPRLEIDQIAVNSETFKSLNVEKEGDYIVTWRDPILDSGGINGLRVVIDDTLKAGARIHPAIDKIYKGDFDGDSFGLKNPQTKAEAQDLLKKLAFRLKLIDKSHQTDSGNYDLIVQDSLDIKSAMHLYPELQQERDELTKLFNDIDRNKFGRKTEEVLDNAMGDLNAHLQKVFDCSYATEVVSFKDMPSHLKSIEHMIETKSKGSYGKLKAYANYLGVDYELDDTKPDGEKIKLDTVVDTGKSLMTRQDDMNVQFAQSVKAYGTGLAGAYSQRAVRALRDVCLTAVLETTSPVTQSALQSKHDAEEAKRKSDVLISLGKAVWRGEKVELKEIEGEAQWVKVKDKNGKVVKVGSRKEFAEQFNQFYVSDVGINVGINKNHVDLIADALCKNDGEGFRVLNIEKDFDELGVSPLDRISYGGDIKTVRQLVDKGANLFDGHYNSFLKPNIIRQNERKAEFEKNHQATLLETQQAVTKSDFKAKNKIDTFNFEENVPNKAVEESVRVAREITRLENEQSVIDDIETEVEASDYDDFGL